jgi:putative colanic acid biosynthesis UDP-glucose lipid carrier transferase
MREFLIIEIMQDSIPSGRRVSGYGRYLHSIYVLCDLVVVNLAALSAWCFYPGLSCVDGVSGEKLMWLLANIAMLPSFYFQKEHAHARRAVQMEGVVRGVFYTLGLHVPVFLSLMIIMGLQPPEVYRAIGFFYLNFLVLLFIMRISVRLLVKYLRRKGHNSAKVVIIGTDETAGRLYEAMKADKGFGYNVLGVFGDHAPAGIDAPYLGPVAGLGDFMSKKNVDQIFYTLSGHHEAMSYVTAIADNNVADFYYVPQISRYYARRFQLNNIGSMPVLSTLSNPLNSWTNRVLKRSFDLLVSGTFLIFYPLIYIPVAIAVKASSPGPVYFRQKRTGYLGKDFDCLKFRTMKMNKDSDKAQATADDPRKTRLGAFLRKTSLDELPQFINVFRGDMSVVGPRPHMLIHTEQYTRLVDRYMVRHSVKPGITGWAQVNGYRGITDELWKMEKRVEYDVWYIEHWSFLLDLKIMVRTVWNAVRGEKNAF